MPADYRDTLQAVHRLISETRDAPDQFRSFHWMISTNDHWRFADSSAMLGGPFDMSGKVTKTAPFSSVLDTINKMLSMPYIYAADIPLPLHDTDAIAVSSFFADAEPDRVLIVVASGRRFADQSGWSIKLVFVGLEQAERFLTANEGHLAVTKPLAIEIFHSKRPVEPEP